MKRRSICLFLAGALLLGLTACGPATVETPSPSPAADVPSTPSPSVVPESPEPTLTPVPIPSLEPVIIETADIPAGNYAPWQGAYVRFLEELRGEEAAFELWYDELLIQDRWDQKVYSKIAMHSDSYWLYDIDENGIPELMIQYGNCEAAYYTYCYTYREGEVVCIGDFGCGHTSLWSWPGENGMLQFFYGVEHKFTIVDGELKMGGHRFDIPEGYYEEKGLDWTQHPDPADFIPGSEYIPNHRILADPGNRKSPVLALPIYDYGALPREKSTPMEENEVRAAIGKVLWEGAELFGISGYGTVGDTGIMTWEEYLKAGASFTWSEKPLEVPRYAWADMNGDGQTDCVLFVGSTDAYDYTVTNYVILNVEDGMVYAYFYDCNLNGFAITADGTVYFDCGFGEWGRESFYKNQCYRYPVQAPAEWDDLAWEEFPPTP